MSVLVIPETNTKYLIYTVKIYKFSIWSNLVKTYEISEEMIIVRYDLTNLHPTNEVYTAT